ncbi:MAG: hypothetical protein HC876_05400 [Chloroflexaceae bacterium]|nr:hypothetical protein [Chloroflexaceae bacterium]
MRFIKLIGLTVLLTVTSFFTTASAQAQITFAPLSSMRADYIRLFNGEPVQVCQGEFVSLNRVHAVCEDLADTVLNDFNRLEAGRITEVVLYDGVFYERINDDTIWYAFNDTIFDEPALENLFQLQIERFALSEQRVVGPVTIDGQATTHIQFGTEQQRFYYDLFITEDGYVLKDQFTTIRTIGDEVIEDVAIATYSAFNSDIVIGPPPADQVVFADN